MKTFFRFQYGSYTLEQMQDYVSDDGGDDGGEEGICATESVADLINNTVWTASDAHDAEVVIMRGQRLSRIYDGVRVYPTEIIARMKPSEFYARRDEIAETYEVW